MAYVDEEQKPSFKHYCRVCKKGFMCGRALGGHMRAHGIGDDRANMDDDDDDEEASDWEQNHGDNKRMYQLRANPNRLKSTRVCENCGKEFLSWKSFLEHGKYCGSDDAYDDHSLVSSPCSDGEEYNIGERKGYGWSKRKRSLRTKVGTFTSSYNTNNTYSSEQEDLLLAKWLIDLANSRVDPLTIEPEESCASASKDEEKRNPIMTYLSTSGLMNQDKDLEHHRKSDFFILPSLDKAKVAPKGLFECKACKKVFNSHQALGGHRASHKKVKGCYAAKQDQLDDNNTHDHQDNYFKGSKPSSYNYQFEQGSSLTGASRKKSKVHECSICHRVFSTGQALGGHKRCHWITSNSQDSSIFTPKFHFHNPLKQINERSTLENQDPLDLNIPPNDQNMSRIRQEPWKIINPFEVSTDIHMHPWSSTNSDHTKKETKDDVVYHNNHEQPREENEDDNFKNKNNNNNNNNTDKNNNVHQDIATQINGEDDDEADSKLKLAKLSDLTTSGNPSQWLQVGIGPTNKVEADS